MKVNINKKTRKVTSINWAGTMTDDDGTRIATMTAMLDVTHPLGTTSMTAINQDLYAKNEEAVKAAYSEFSEQVRQAAENTDLVVEEDDPPVI